MWHVLIEKATGLVVAYQPSPFTAYDATTHLAFIVRDEPAPVVQLWNGRDGLRPMTPVERAGLVTPLKDAESARLLGRAIDASFLDGFWLVFKVIGPVGVAGIDDAVLADDRAAFDQFFIAQVKARLS